MKTKIIALVIATLTLAHAAEKLKAPNNGRIINTVTPHAEFLVNPEKKLEIRFLDAACKVIAPAAQVVTVTMGDRAAPTKLAFTKDGDKLVSDKVIPEGKELPVVLQIKSTPDAKMVSAKFNLNLSPCPDCKVPEYACDCHGEPAAHEHKPGEKHDH